MVRILALFIFFLTSAVYCNRGEVVESLPISTHGARAEVLWVVNHTDNTNSLVGFTKRRLKTYYEVLRNQSVHHMTAYLSANPYWHPHPVVSESAKPLVYWDNLNWLGEFGSFFWAGWVTDDTVASPIWALNCFLGTGTIPMEGCYRETPGVTELYQKDFMEPGVPLDIIILNNRSDRFAWWARKTEQKEFSAIDYGKQFVQYFENENKSLRISALGYRQSGVPDGAETKALVDLTHGSFVTVPMFSFDVDRALRDLATQIANRALLSKYQRIKLTKQPSENTTIQVKLNEDILDASTWEFESTSRQIVLHWDLIGEHKLAIGSTIEIQYSTD